MTEKCADNCPLIPRVEALERANEQHGSTHREMYDRLRVSAPVIKCKKTPRKKCSFMAEEAKKR